MKKGIKYMISAFCACIVIFIMILFIIVPFQVTSHQWTPMIQQGDRFLINQLAPRLNTIDNKDYVVYRNKDQFKIGRVIGKPGQSIAIQNNELYIDNQRVKDTHIEQLHIGSWASRRLSQQESDIIAPGQYVVLQHNSKGHNTEPFGTVRKNDIIGTILLRYYPFEKITLNLED